MQVEKLISGSNMRQDEADRIRFEVTKVLQSYKPTADNITAGQAGAAPPEREGGSDDTAE